MAACKRAVMALLSPLRPLMVPSRYRRLRMGLRRLQKCSGTLKSGKFYMMTRGLHLNDWKRLFDFSVLFEYLSDALDFLRFTVTSLQHSRWSGRSPLIFSYFVLMLQAGNFWADAFHSIKHWGFRAPSTSHWQSVSVDNVSTFHPTLLESDRAARGRSLFAKRMKNREKESNTWIHSCRIHWPPVNVSDFPPVYPWLRSATSGSRSHALRIFKRCVLQTRNIAVGRTVVWLRCNFPRRKGCDESNAGLRLGVFHACIAWQS